MSATTSHIKLPESPKIGYEVKLATPAEAREFKDGQIYWFCTFEHPDEWIGPCTSSGCCVGLHLRYAYLSPIAGAHAALALVIEVGKFYKTRDGGKARIYATDGKDGWPIHGAILGENGWFLGSWSKDGFTFDEPNRNANDLIGPWIDRPEIDFSKWPDWVVAIGQDDDTNWYAHDMKPNAGKTGWFIAGGNFMRIPPEYAPKWEGDWRDSLVVRPEGK